MRKLLFGLLVITLLLIGCSAAVQKSADGLMLTQQTVINIAGSIDHMCSAGTLTQDQCDSAAKLYSEAKEAYGVALEAELLVIDAAVVGTGLAEAEENYTVAVGAWTSIATKLITFAAKLGLLEE